MGLAENIASIRPWKCRPQVLLCANTAKPMHGVVPRVILGKEWWDREREAAYQSTNYHCVACGVHKNQAKEHRWLEGHEVYRVDYLKGRQTYIETVPLCYYCHSFIHSGRLRALLDKDEIEQEKYDAIISHGNLVLKEAGLKRMPLYTGKIAPWEKWRLVLFGVEYPPLFPNYEAWRAWIWEDDE
jgi:hypothetical protein